MKEDSLNLSVGSSVQLQLDGPDGPDEAPRHVVRVIGYVPGGSLVVTTPSVSGKVQIVREGQKFNVRMLRRDSVVGFNTPVLVSTMKPYPHLHLGYPKVLEQIVVRNSARVGTQISCRVRNTDQKDAAENSRSGVIVDLSETGAKMISGMPLGAPGDMLQIDFKLELIGQDESISLLADLMNVNERIEKDQTGRRLSHITGDKFRTSNRYQQILLHAWVMGQVANVKSPFDAARAD